MENPGLKRHRRVASDPTQPAALGQTPQTLNTDPMLDQVVPFYESTRENVETPPGFSGMPSLDPVGTSNGDSRAPSTTTPRFGATGDGVDANFDFHVNADGRLVSPDNDPPCETCWLQRGHPDVPEHLHLDPLDVASDHPFKPLVMEPDRRYSALEDRHVYDHEGWKTFIDPDIRPESDNVRMNHTDQPMIDFKHDYNEHAPDSILEPGWHDPGESCETCYLREGDPYTPSREFHESTGFHPFKPMTMEPGQRYSAIQTKHINEEDGTRTFIDTDIRPDASSYPQFGNQPMITFKHDYYEDEPDVILEPGHHLPGDTCETCYLQHNEPYSYAGKEHEQYRGDHPFKPMRMEPNQRYSALQDREVHPGEGWKTFIDTDIRPLDDGENHYGDQPMIDFKRDYRDDAPDLMLEPGWHNPGETCEHCYVRRGDSYSPTGEEHDQLGLSHPYKPLEMEPGQRYSALVDRRVHPEENWKTFIDTDIRPESEGIRFNHGDQPMIDFKHDYLDKNSDMMLEPGYHDPGETCETCYLQHGNEISASPEAHEQHGLHPFKPMTMEPGQRYSAYDPERGEWIYNTDDPDYFENDPAPSHSSWTAMPMFNEVEQHHHQLGDLDEDDTVLPGRPDRFIPNVAYRENDEVRRMQQEAAFDPERGEFIYDIERPNYYNEDPPRSWENANHGNAMFDLKRIFDGSDDSSPDVIEADYYRHPNYQSCADCFRTFDGFHGEHPQHPVHTDLTHWEYHKYNPMPDLPAGERLAAVGLPQTTPNSSLNEAAVPVHTGPLHMTPTAPAQQAANVAYDQAQAARQEQIAQEKQVGGGSTGANPAWTKARQDLDTKMMNRRMGHPLHQAAIIDSSEYADEDPRSLGLRNFHDTDFPAPSEAATTSQPMIQLKRTDYGGWPHNQTQDDYCETCWLNDEAPKGSRKLHDLGLADHPFKSFNDEGQSQRFSSAKTWDMLDERPEGFNLPNFYRGQGFQVSEDQNTGLARIFNRSDPTNPSGRGLINVYPQYEAPHDENDTADPEHYVGEDGGTGGSPYNPETEPCSTCWVHRYQLVPKHEHDYYMGDAHPWRGFEHPEQGMGRFGAYNPEKDEWEYPIDEPYYWLRDQPPSRSSNSAQQMVKEKSLPYEEEGEETPGDDTPEWQFDWDEPYHHTPYPHCEGCAKLRITNADPPGHGVHNPLTQGQGLSHRYKPIEETSPGERLAAFNPEKNEFEYDIDRPNYYLLDPAPSRNSNSAQQMVKEKDIPYEDYEEDELPGEQSPNYRYRWDEPYYHPGYSSCAGCIKAGLKNSDPPGEGLHDPNNSASSFYHPYKPIEETRPGERLASWRNHPLHRTAIEVGTYDSEKEYPEWGDPSERPFDLRDYYRAKGFNVIGPEGSNVDVWDNMSLMSDPNGSNSVNPAANGMFDLKGDDDYGESESRSLSGDYDKADKMKERGERPVW